MSRLQVIQEVEALPAEEAVVAPWAERKIYIDTYGCQMNAHDSARIAGLMASEGYATTENPDDADLIVINSCHVREKAAHKLRSAAGKMKHVKRRNPETVIALGGCTAQAEGSDLLKKIPHADLVFGPDHISRLPDLVRRIQSDRVRLEERDFLSRDTYEFPAIRPEADKQISAFVTVMKGCDKYCSFCVVPMTRGREVSREADDIVREVQMLAELGTREVVLLGQTVNSYGRIKQQGQIPFAELLARVAEVEGIERVRFTSPHPGEFSEDQIRAFAEIPELCPHMHLPVQSGSTRVLNAMRRGYSRETFIDICERFKAMVPQAHLTTDIIVGFPGETVAEFEETLSLMEHVRFSGSFSFAYSERTGTKAVEIEDAIEPQERLRRLHVLQALQAEHTNTHLAAMVGTAQNLLIEGPSKSDPTRSTGRTPTNRPVHVPGIFEPGAILDVTIVEAYKHSLLGRTGRKRSAQ